MVINKKFWWLADRIDCEKKRKHALQNGLLKYLTRSKDPINSFELKTKV